MSKIKQQNDKNLTACYLYDSFSEKIDFMQRQIFTLLEKYENQQKIINIMSHQQDIIETENKNLKEQLQQVQFNSENYRNYDHQLMAFEKQMQKVLQNQQQLYYDSDRQFQNIQKQYLQQFEQQVQRIVSQNLQQDEFRFNNLKSDVQDRLDNFQKQIENDFFQFQSKNIIQSNKVKSQIENMNSNFKSLTGIQKKIIQQQLKKDKKNIRQKSGQSKQSKKSISRISSPQKILKTKKSPNRLRFNSLKK